MPVCLRLTISTGCCHGHGKAYGKPQKKIVPLTKEVCRWLWEEHQEWHHPGNICIEIAVLSLSPCVKDNCSNCRNAKNKSKYSHLFCHLDIELMRMWVARILTGQPSWAIADLRAHKSVHADTNAGKRAVQKAYDARPHGKPIFGLKII